MHSTSFRLPMNGPWTVVFLALWFGLGLWWLDRLSVHRSLQGQAEVRPVQWTLTTSRLLRPREEFTFGGLDLQRAEVERTSGSSLFPATSQLMLHTREGRYWLGASTSGGFRDQERLAAELNAFLRAPAGGTLRIPGDYPAVFFLAAAGYVVLSLLLLGGVALAGRRH
jgi:hypothetical protein